MCVYDTVVIGGGPAGSTVASLLKKYDSDHRVLVLERERFPRDHVGESQLPLIGAILDEMGVWDAVERAGFPIKVGATYRWGTTSDLWHFNFVPDGKLDERPRPDTYDGQRQATAFQVDRALYDDILLRHAAEMGAEVRQETRVVEVLKGGDRVSGLRLASGEVVTANHYVDATGGAGLLRRAMEVEVESPTSLRNIAIWDYWQNAEWAEEIGVGGTRVQVMSLGYGWIWFIPLGPTRTSVGLIVPAAYYKEQGLKPRALYERALAEEPRIAALLRNATSEGKLASTNDWSYVAGRMAGENWFLAGDSCGFADPILAAGMTLAHSAAREVAYTILEIERGGDAAWLKSAYDDVHRRRIRQHIRFADYWYSANGQFSELVEYTAEIARDAGLDLEPAKAFQWLGTGGFANDDLGEASLVAYSLAAVKRLTQWFSGGDADWKIETFNEFRLNLDGVREALLPAYENGRVLPIRAWLKGARRLPLSGPFGAVVTALRHSNKAADIARYLDRTVPPGPEPYRACLHALEAMVTEGWVKPRRDPKRPSGFGLNFGEDSPLMRKEPALSSLRRPGEACMPEQ